MFQSYRLYANKVSVDVISEDEWVKLASGYANSEDYEVIRLSAITNWETFWEGLFLRTFSCSVLLLVPDVLAGWQEICDHFTLVPAAGGVVQNECGQVLVIYRRGMWDFPKGKIDVGEDNEQAALREVKEETGISDLLVDYPILLYGQQEATYHTYREGSQWICKPTYWYAMRSSSGMPLQPQLEEDITAAVWKSHEDVTACLASGFPSLLDVWYSWQQKC